MKFVLISGKCRDSGGKLIAENTEYEAKNKAELFEKHPSLMGKVRAVRETVKLEVATPEVEVVAEHEPEVVAEPEVVKCKSKK